MSTNCIRCVKNPRDGSDLLCATCRESRGIAASFLVVCIKGKFEAVQNAVAALAALVKPGLAEIVIGVEHDDQAAKDGLAALQTHPIRFNFVMQDTGLDITKRFERLAGKAKGAALIVLPAA